MKLHHYFNLDPVGQNTRSYIIVIDADGCNVQRIIATPEYDACSSNPDMYQALREKWIELTGTYAAPKYDVVSGTGSLFNIQTSLPECNGWNTIPLEQLEWNSFPSRPV